MGWNPFKDSWSNVWDDFRSIGRAVDDFFHGDWDSAAKEFSQSGFIGDKIFKPVFRVADDVVDSGVVGVVNPVAGAVFSYGRDGEEGLIKSMVSTISGNILTGGSGNAFNFSAAGRPASVEKVFKDLVHNPEKFVKENVLPVMKNGGNVDVGDVFTYAIAQQKGGVSASDKEMAAVVEAVGKGTLGESLTSIMSSGGFGGIEGMANLYEYFKEWEEDEAPSLPEMTPMSDEVVEGWINEFKEDLSDQKIEQVKRLQGIASRSGFDDGQYMAGLENINEQQADALSDFERQAKQQQLEYNNQLAQQQYQNETQLYTIQQQRKQDVLNALANNIYTTQQNNPNMSTDQIVSTAVNGVNELFKLIGIDLNLGNDSVIIDESGGMQVNTDAIDNLTMPGLTDEEINNAFSPTEGNARVQVGARGVSREATNPNQMVNDLYIDRVNSLGRMLNRWQIELNDPNLGDRRRAELQRDMQYAQEMYNELITLDPTKITTDLGFQEDAIRSLGYGQTEELANSMLSPDKDLLNILTDEAQTFIRNNPDLGYMDKVKRIHEMGGFKTPQSRQTFYTFQSNLNNVGAGKYYANDLSGYKGTDMYKQLQDSGSRLRNILPDIAFLSNLRDLNQNYDLEFGTYIPENKNAFDRSGFEKFYQKLNKAAGGNIGNMAYYIPYYEAYKDYGLNQFIIGGKNITLSSPTTKSNSMMGAVGAAGGTPRPRISIGRV